MLTATLLAHHRDAEYVLPDPLCVLIYVVAVIATILAVVLGLAALIGRPIAPWVPAAVVAAIGWLVYLFLC